MNFRHRRKYTCCHKQCPHKNKIHLQSPVRCLWFSFTYVPPEIVILFDFPLPFNVLLSFQFLLNPCHNHIHKIVLLHLTQSPSRLHFVPFSDAFPATGCSGMLCYKYRMSSHRRLFSIIRYICRCLPLCNKILGMFPDRIKPFFIYIINIFLLQMETAPKSRIAKSLKELVIPFIFCHKNSPRF